MSDNIAAGSGLIKIAFDREEKRIKMDFSGNFEDNSCFRNDASILFFASNSYRSAFLSLGRDLNNRFEKYILKDIEHLIIPYLFNFRHFVELELKALYVAITNKSPVLTHDLKKLLDVAGDALEYINFEKIDKMYYDMTEEKFNELKEEVISVFNHLKRMVEQYNSTEVAVEYYRYIFENDKKVLSLKNPIIQLDFNATNELFLNIRNSVDKLRLTLRELIYIQFSF